MSRINKERIESERKSLEDALRAVGFDKNIIEPLEVKIYRGNASQGVAWSVSFYKGHMVALEGNSDREAMQQLKAMNYVLRTIRA